MKEGASVIHSRFLNLDTEKKQRIINAAMNEFISSGYERASTNEIVKEAKISKGSLFHYFNNKKDLYLFLFEYSIDVSYQIFERMDWSETDILIRFKQLVLIKFDIMKQYPEIFNFAKSVYEEQSKDVKDDIANKISQMNQSGYEKLYQNIDLTRFRDDIDVMKVIQIIQWTLEKLGETEYTKIKFKPIEEYNSENFIKEMEQYLDLMKRCFYK